MAFLESLGMSCRHALQMMINGLDKYLDENIFMNFWDTLYDHWNWRYAREHFPNEPDEILTVLVLWKWLPSTWPSSYWYLCNKEVSGLVCLWWKTGKQESDINHATLFSSNISFKNPTDSLKFVKIMFLVFRKVLKNL